MLCDRIRTNRKIFLTVVIITAIIAVFLKFKPREGKDKSLSKDLMEKIYKEIKTPFRYGIVLKHPDSTKLIDSPTVFREGDGWFMTYIVYDGKGYETWLAESDDLLHWTTMGRILSFSDSTWDANQKAGYLSLVDITWGGSYKVEKYGGNYWMSYLGGNSCGYEAGILATGMAFTDDLTAIREWKRMSSPVLRPDDRDAGIFDNRTIFKSLVIHDRKQHTGYPFIMYYNAKGSAGDFESISMAVSRDMINWKRYGKGPVVTKQKGICGDAQVARINDIYVMFYFGAFWKPGAFERFACSRDLIHWTDWDGADLIAPSEDYDSTYAHKPWVVKWKGTVYHFYTAVGNRGRVIALATSERITR